MTREERDELIALRESYDQEVLDLAGICHPAADSLIHKAEAMIQLITVRLDEGDERITDRKFNQATNYSRLY